MKNSLNFDIKKSTNDLYSLRVRISCSGVRGEFLLGINIKESDWDKTSKRAKRTTKNAARINNTINRCELLFDNFFTRCELDKIPITKELIDKTFNAEFRPERVKKIKIGFYDIFDKFVSEQSVQNSWSYKNIQKFQTLKNNLYQYNPSLILNELTESQLQGFIQYLINKNQHNTTISKNIEYIRWFLRWAFRRGIYTGNLHEIFKPRLKASDGSQKEVIYLSWEELMNLYNYQFNEFNKNLEQVRDVFCFCCFTGLRFSDVFNLKKSDIKNDTIKIVTQKTTDPLTIELNNYSREILDKYKGIRGMKALPVISNQKTNDNLKIIGGMAGLNSIQKVVYFVGNQRYEEYYKKYELLSTHCGRRTFIVNALYLGIPAEVVMSWTGHSSFASMKPYVKIIDELKKESMDKFNIPQKFPKNNVI